MVSDSKKYFRRQKPNQGSGISGQERKLLLLGSWEQERNDGPRRTSHQHQAKTATVTKISSTATAGVSASQNIAGLFRETGLVDFCNS
jgi:hypothetical protein